MLLGDVLELEGLPFFYIDSAVQQLTDLQREVDSRYRAKAKAVISRIRLSHSRRPSAHRL